MNLTSEDNEVEITQIDDKIVIEKNKKDLNYLRENIGIVFQNPDNQIIGSTVYEELSFGLINLGLSKKEIEERIEKISQKLNLKK